MAVSPYNLCFKISPVQEVYSPENISNGYSRPYGLPNCWVSNGSEKTEWVEMAFDQPQTIDTLILYLDSNLDCQVWNVRREQDETVMPTLAKNYRVYCNDGKDWKKLTEVRDNHQRVVSRKPGRAL